MKITIIINNLYRIQYVISSIVWLIKCIKYQSANQMIYYFKMYEPMSIMTTQLKVNTDGLNIIITSFQTYK